MAGNASKRSVLQLPSAVLQSGAAEGYARVIPAAAAVVFDSCGRPHTKHVGAHNAVRCGRPQTRKNGYGA